MSFVPEDRLGMGLVASMGMVDNMLLKSYTEGKGPFVERKPARELAQKLVEKLAIVTPGVDTPVRLMSGGNVQKVLLGREIESSPQVLITAYPVSCLLYTSPGFICEKNSSTEYRGVCGRMRTSRVSGGRKAKHPYEAAAKKNPRTCNK